LEDKRNIQRPRWNRRGRIIGFFINSFNVSEAEEVELVDEEENYGNFLLCKRNALWRR